MSEKTVFVLWGWYEAAEPLDQKVMGIFNTEEEATAVRDSYSMVTSPVAFVLYEAPLGREWQASLPGEVPNQIYFVYNEGVGIWSDIDMELLRRILNEQAHMQGIFR
jgi:hypothetical protein